MSIFEQAPEAQPQATEAPQAEATETTNQESFVAKLVAERGDNWSDPEVLAKGKLEADSHIKNLEDQLASLRQDLAKQDYSAELLKQLQGKAPESTTGTPEVPTENTGSTQPEHTTPELSEDVLKSLVEKTLTEREASATKEQNIKAVTDAMTEKYGTEANAVVAQKAQELGMSVERLQTLAEESPNAFLSLVGEPPVSAPTMTRGSVKTEAIGNAAPERDFGYYQEMRRKNRSLYYSPKMQQQMIEDKMRLGSKFGN